jgi:hypothetical protein
MEKNLEWCVNLCRANKKMMSASREEILEIVDNYPISRRLTDYLLGKVDYSAAEYNMACRFLKRKE